MLALLATAVVLLALAAATFTLSYSGIHAIALGAGVPPRLARVYPGLLDAALVVACVAAIALWDSKWWARWYAWLVVMLMVVIGGGADALHAMNVALPHQKTAAVIAAVPWLLLLLAFSLWLTVLRQSRSRRGAAPQDPAKASPQQGDAKTPAPAPASWETPAPTRGPESTTLSELMGFPEPASIPEPMTGPVPPEAAPPGAPEPTALPSATPLPAPTNSPSAPATKIEEAKDSAGKAEREAGPAAEPESSESGDVSAGESPAEGNVASRVDTGHVADGETGERNIGDEGNGDEPVKATLGEEGPAETQTVHDEDLAAREAADDEVVAVEPAEDEEPAAEIETAHDQAQAAETVAADDVGESVEAADDDEGPAQRIVPLADTHTYADTDTDTDERVPSKALDYWDVEDGADLPGRAYLSAPTAEAPDAEEDSDAADEEADAAEEDSDAAEEEADTGEEDIIPRDDEPGPEERGAPLPLGTLPEVHHSLSDLAAQAPPLPIPPAPRLNRLRSTPVPPGEDAEQPE